MASPCRLQTVWITLGALALVSPTVKGNDLLRLYQLARSHDATLATTAFARDAAAELPSQARAQLLPQLQASASADRERVGSLSSGSYAGSGTSAALSGSLSDCTAMAAGLLQHCTGNQHSVSLTLSQTLWSVTSWERLKETSLQAAGADATLESARQDLLLRVAQAYFAILSARDLLATNRSERVAFAELLHQAQVRAQTGLGPRSDVEQAQAYYDATEQPVTDASNALDDASLAMQVIAGPYPRPATQLAPLREEIPLMAPQPDSADSWVALARTNNPAAEAASLAAKAAAREMRAQRGRMLPTVSLYGESSRLWQNPVLGGNQTLDEVGVTVTWPLFQGGGALAATHEARALYRQSESQYTAEIRGVESQTRAAYRNVVNGIRDITASRRSLESARTAVEASRRAVEFGTGSEFELLQFQDNYYVAERAYNQARYDYLTNLLVLKQQAGQLTEGDLEKVDGLLVEQSP